MHDHDIARRALGNSAAPRAVEPPPTKPSSKETSPSLPAARRKSVTWRGHGDDAYTAPRTEEGGGGDGRGRAAEAKATVRVNRHGSIFVGGHAERMPPPPPPPGRAPTERKYNVFGAVDLAAAPAEESNDDGGDDDDDSFAHNIYGGALSPPRLTLGRAV